jgi:4-amino-4-deoxy-L-arabinose transferase-like glycosyltransferase
MSVRSGLIIILALTLWRIILLRFDVTDLFVDEAQYWLWSQHLDFGYYSKPPMIAWVLRAVTALGGSNDIFWVRVAGPIFHAGTALVLMAASRRFIGPEISGWAGVTFVTAPAVALSSVFFSTDDILLFFIAIALWAYFALTERRSIGLAIVMGVTFGCAFLSKYAVLFLLPGGLVALILLREARIGWRDFFIAVLAAALVALPNLWWNLTHDITTVRHTQDIAHWSKLGIHLVGGIGFFFAQFGVIGPIVFAAMLWACYRMARGVSEPKEKMLVWLSIPVVLLITLQALIAKAYANWAVTAYVAGAILAVWVLHRFWPRGLWISLAINGLVSVLFPIATILAHDLVLPNGKEALGRFLGRAEVSRKAGDLAKQAGLSIIVSDDRDITADLFYTLRAELYRLYASPPAGFPKSYYEQELALPGNESGKVLFVTRHLMTCAVEQPETLASWTPDHGYYKGKTLYAYKVAPMCLEPVKG